MNIQLIRAEKFTIQELTDIYNQTRVDYLVPMPMNAIRLSEYINDYDVDLSQSCVARDEDGQLLGLCMLGMRQQTAWITRLGVLPNIRRGGVGSTLMNCMLENAHFQGARKVQLEVIRNNIPAYDLFRRKQFIETQEYLVLRRAPHLVSSPKEGELTWLNAQQALEFLKRYPYHLTWINDIASMQNAGDVEGLHVELEDGSSGWVIYRNTRFTLRSTISHLVIHTLRGDPHVVGEHLLLNLHGQYPSHDTYAENIPDNDAHLSAFRKLGYFENFARIEMLYCS